MSSADSTQRDSSSAGDAFSRPAFLGKVSLIPMFSELSLCSTNSEQFEGTKYINQRHEKKTRNKEHIAQCKKLIVTTRKAGKQEK